MITFRMWIIFGLAAVAGVALLFTFERPPVETVQRGYRGVGMMQVFDPRVLAKQSVVNQLPEAIDPVDKAGTPSSEAYQNVQVLGDVDSNEFLRLMSAITAWVAPEQGCNYCHVQENLALDTLYTKVVARKMFQMVRRINGGWKTHVAQTGVTCYTCHRGQPVPANIWFQNPGPPHAGGMAEAGLGKNYPTAAINYSSLPYDPFTPFLDQKQNIRVASTTALPEADRSSIKQTDWTYALMIHFSQSLGVNCTYCHNTRQFASWEQSTPQRTTAWYGIRMVRDLNNNYLEGLHDVFPAGRLGPLNDVAKINCTTCHQGIYKPLFGASMLADFPELAGGPITVSANVPPAAPGPAAAPDVAAAPKVP